MKFIYKKSVYVISIAVLLMLHLLMILFSLWFSALDEVTSHWQRLLTIFTYMFSLAFSITGIAYSILRIKLESIPNYRIIIYLIISIFLVLPFSHSAIARLEEKNPLIPIAKQYTSAKFERSSAAFDAKRTKAYYDLSEYFQKERYIVDIVSQYLLLDDGKVIKLYPETPYELDSIFNQLVKELIIKPHVPVAVKLDLADMTSYRFNLQLRSNIFNDRQLDESYSEIPGNVYINGELMQFYIAKASQELFDYYSSSDRFLKVRYLD